MARKLATIQKIKELNPILGADKIEVASVLGWKCVVEKGKFKVGDWCIYCEIDSIMPSWNPDYEFLKDRHYRVRTIRLRGQISQGLVLPITTIRGLPETLKEGEDVTEILGIEQYIPQIPANIAGFVKGLFPTFIPKTDETRVQVLQEVLTRYKDTLCYITEKVDGSSVTYYIKDGEFGVCSRNLELKETEDNLFWKMARQLEVEEKLKLFGKNVAIQGELVGPGVQKNNLKLPEHHILFFTGFDIDKYQYLDVQQFGQLMNILDLETVPFVNDIYPLSDNIDSLVEMAKGFSKLNPKVYREGVVIRPIDEKIDLQMSNSWGNGRVSFKVINPEYLLKYE